MSPKYWLQIGIILLTIQLGLVGYLYFQFFTRSTGHYYGKSPNVPAVELTALDRPNVSSKALLSWATLAATATFTFDFVNYKTNLNALRDYFTEDGYQSFVTALQANKILATIEEKKLVISAVVVGPSIITTEGEENGLYTWHVEVPLLVRYQSADANETRQKVISLSITQVPTTIAPKGIGIAKYVENEVGPEVTG